MSDYIWPVAVFDSKSKDANKLALHDTRTAQPAIGAVSWIAPIAKGLIGHQVGDEVTLRLPRGEEVLEIVDIEY